MKFFPVAVTVLGTIWGRHAGNISRSKSLHQQSNFSQENDRNNENSNSRWNRCHVDHNNNAETTVQQIGTRNRWFVSFVTSCAELAGLLYNHSLFDMIHIWLHPEYEKLTNLCIYMFIYIYIYLELFSTNGNEILINSLWQNVISTPHKWKEVKLVIYNQWIPF